jgi:hypothetical protein
VNSGTVAGFWSYTHEDNTLDGGAILRLATSLMEEFSLLSGSPLTLFVDRNDISWGDEWRNRVDFSLASSAFFIPIITPRYFTRAECRRELLEFAAKAKSLGISELLLPILYVETPGLSEESPDEAIVLVAKTQYVDWRDIRLLEPSCRDYRVAVNSLARRLLEISAKTGEDLLDRELGTDLEDDGVGGITDIVERISALLPDWLDVVLNEKTNDAQMEGTFRQSQDQMIKAKKRGAPASALLAIQVRPAKEMLPLAERAISDARVYSNKSIELDPLVTGLARMVKEHPDQFELATPIREAVDEAMDEIRKNEAKSKSPNFIMLRDYFRSISHLGRIFQKCVNILDNRSHLVDQGNDIVKRWDIELKESPGA